MKLEFGQIVRGDEEKACRNLCELFVSREHLETTVPVSSRPLPRRLEAVPVQLYRRETTGHPDSRAVPNVVK